MGFFFILYLTWFLVFLKCTVGVSLSWTIVCFPILSISGFWLIIYSYIWYYNKSVDK